MSKEFERGALEAKMKRQFGMSAEGVAKLREFNAKQTDWYAKCRVCGRELRGSLAEVSVCKHGE